MLYCHHRGDPLSKQRTEITSPFEVVTHCRGVSSFCVCLCLRLICRSLPMPPILCYPTPALPAVRPSRISFFASLLAHLLRLFIWRPLGLGLQRVSIATLRAESSAPSACGLHGIHDHSTQYSPGALLDSGWSTLQIFEFKKWAGNSNFENETDGGGGGRWRRRPPLYTLDRPSGTVPSAAPGAAEHGAARAALLPRARARHQRLVGSAAGGGGGGGGAGAGAGAGAEVGAGAWATAASVVGMVVAVAAAAALLARLHRAAARSSRQLFVEQLQAQPARSPSAARAQLKRHPSASSSARPLRAPGLLVVASPARDATALTSASHSSRLDLRD